MRMINLIRRRVAGGARLLCVLVMCLGACSRPDTQTELNAAAASFSAGNYEDAALRLNYVVQIEPDNIRARELRGDIALLLGDYTNAAIEFDRARALGASEASVALGLAEAHAAQGQVETALEILDAAEPQLANDAHYWTLRAEALLAGYRLQEAASSIEQAAKVGDGGARSLTTAAQIAFARGDRAGGFDLLEQALRAAPADPRVRIAHAELLARADRLADAAAELQRAANLYRELSIGPRETLSLLGLIQLHLARNDLLAAETVAARLAEHAPEVQSTAYFQGLVKFRSGNFDEAAALIQPLVNAAPQTIEYRSLLGAIQLARGNLGQAEQQFLRVLAASPRDPAASKLLAETRLRQQRPAAALDALTAVQDTASDDPQIGLLSGIATVLSGNAEQGLLYLEQAAALDPTNELVKLQLARAYLATGRDADASRLLQTSFGGEAHAVEAQLLRLFAASRRDDNSATAAIAEELVAEHLDDPRVLTAVAVHYQLHGDKDRARGLFERAAVSESGDATARLFVAASLVQEGRQDEAEVLLRQTLRQQPENAQVLTGLAQLLARRGLFDEAVALFSRAAELTTSVIPRLALVQMQLRMGNLSEARRQLNSAAAAAPENANVIALGGVLALAEGRADEAVALLDRAALLLPDRLGVTLVLARAKLANGQAADARETLLQALEIAPQSYPVRLALGDAELENGNAEAALSIATDLKVAAPSQAGGYLLEGKVLIAVRQYSAAGRSLAMAFDRQPTWPILAMNIQALRLAGQPQQALERIEAWIADNPRHVPASLMRGVLLQAGGRASEALDAYRSVLTLAPDNLVALNNAAWVSHELGEPDALTLAERAARVGPGNAAVLDTYGWILLARGQGSMAIENLSRAVELAPQVPEIRYHLAEALAAGGQSARAREILTALLAEVREFDKRADAERLLESMQPEVL